MERPYLEVIAEAFDCLLATADKDGCYCESEENCTIETPACDVRRAIRARWLLDKILTPKPESLHPERLTHPPERIYFELWCKQNERSPGINGGYTLLEWLLCPSDKRHPEEVASFRDTLVAACVIQWLGTSGGRCFLAEAERKIREEQDDYRTITHEAFQERWNHVTYPRKEKLAEWAHWIASRYKTIAKPDSLELENVLVVALNRAYESGKRVALEANDDEMVKEAVGG